MPYCCVKKCSNSWKKGYSLHRIPKNPERRQQWIENIGRHDLDVLKDCFVCEVHFLPEMWEKPRVDGKKKLKSNAIPTACIQKEIVSASPKKNEIDNAKHLSDNLTVEDTLKEAEYTAIINVDESSICTLLMNLQSTEIDKLINTLTVPTQISKSVIYVPFKIDNSKKHLEETELKVQKTSLDTVQVEIETEQSKLKQVEMKLRQANMRLNKLEKSRIMMKKQIKRLMYEKRK